MSDWWCARCGKWRVESRGAVCQRCDKRRPENRTTYVASPHWKKGGMPRRGVFKLADRTD